MAYIKKEHEELLKKDGVEHKDWRCRGDLTKEEFENVCMKAGETVKTPSRRNTSKK